MNAIFTKSLETRVLSGLLLAPAVLFALIYGSWAFWGMIVLAFCLSVYEWFGLARKGTLFAVIMLAGLVYLLICFGAFIELRIENQGLYLTLALMLTVWASDIGAYFSGKIIGGPKLIPSVSPGKTWAGLFGGIFSSALAMVFLKVAAPLIGGLFAKDVFLPIETIVEAFIVGASITLAGQGGDLLISALKRRVNVKDTGDLIPGHGGLLDRIDSLLLASPVFLLCIWVLV